MVLTLEVMLPQASKLGAARRKTFNEQGGTIGRHPDNFWVLPHSYVSSHHARIRFQNGRFYIEDTSTNGVCVNQSEKPLPPNQPCALSSGDCIFIHPYKIEASVDGEPQQPAISARGDIASDDPFAPIDADRSPRMPLSLADLEARVEPVSSQEVDPLSLLGFTAKPRAVAKTPTAADLDQASVLVEHYQPPSYIHEPPPPGRLIPEDYDPLATNDRLGSVPPDERVPASSRSEMVGEREHPQPPAETTPPIDPEPPAVAPAVAPERPAAVAADRRTWDLSAVLAGAGLDPAAMTPEFAHDFGEILQVVVAGVMDMLRSRREIKDEFRMRGTRVRPIDNNPLKFSADVADALHNLFVKRNPAYLGAVDAFEDAFDELRHHQIAMLAGMRAAFEAMLAEFEPDRLEAQFDRHGKKSSLLGGAAKRHYWDLYSERFHDMVKDEDANFRRLFGEKFAAAYEQQLDRLKAQGRIEHPK